MGQYIYLFSLIYDCCCLVLQIYSVYRASLPPGAPSIRCTPEGLLLLLLLSRDNTPGLFSFYPVR